MKNLKDILIEGKVNFDNDQVIFFTNKGLEALQKFTKNNDDTVHVKLTSNEDDEIDLLYACLKSDIKEGDDVSKWPWKKIWSIEQGEEKIYV